MAKAKSKKAVKPLQKLQLENLYWPFDQKKTLWLTVGFIALIGVIVFWRYISGQFLFIFEDKGSDTITMFYPNIVHLSNYYREVGFPGYSFFVGPGYGIYPGGLLNPLDWIYFLMDAKTIARSIGWVQLCKVIGSGIVFALFLIKIGVERAVMLIGAVLYAFGGYLIVGSSWYIHSTHIFWITVALLGFEMLLRDQKWWLFPIPFIFLVGTRGYFLVIFMMLYAAVRTLDYYEMNWTKLLKVYGRMLLCGVIALLLTAPFVGAKFSKLQNSPRATGNVSKVEVLSDQPVFQPATGKHNSTAILRWFSTDVMGTSDEYVGFRNYLEGPLFYIGLLVLLLLPQFFLLADKRQKWLYGLFLFFWLWLIIFPWFRYAFYAFAGNYYKGALSLFIPFSVLLVSLLGFDKIIKGKNVNLLALSGTMLICFIALWFPYGSLPNGINPDIQMLVSVFLLLEGIVLAGFNFNGTRKFALPILMVLVLTEAGIFAYISNNNRLAVPAADLQKPLRHFDETIQALQYIEKQEDAKFYRTDKVYGSVKTGYNDALVQGFFGTKMYQSHNNKFYVQFLEDMGVIPKGNEASSRWLVGVSKR
ncbi:MAG: YfhO family protein, partial [Chitinophagaceae bacterium]